MKAAQAKHVTNEAQEVSVRIAARLRAVGQQFESADPWRPWSDDDSGPVDEWGTPVVELPGYGDSGGAGPGAGVSGGPAPV